METRAIEPMFNPPTPPTTASTHCPPRPPPPPRIIWELLSPLCPYVTNLTSSLSVRGANEALKLGRPPQQWSTSRPLFALRNQFQGHFQLASGLRYTGSGRQADRAGQKPFDRVPQVVTSWTDWLGGEKAQRILIFSLSLSLCSLCERVKPLNKVRPLSQSKRISWILKWSRAEVRRPCVSQHNHAPVVVNVTIIYIPGLLFAVRSHVSSNSADKERLRIQQYNLTM